MMIKDTPFLRWWLYLGLAALGSAAAGFFGLFGDIYSADSTKISFLMYGLFAIFTVFTGINTKRACGSDPNVPSLCKWERRGYRMSSFLMGLGLIGTVLGFIEMSKVSFIDLSMDNAAGMRDALANMGGGISTALYTTAVGQILGWSLRLQMDELSEQIVLVQADNHCDCCTCKAARESDNLIGEEEDE